MAIQALDQAGATVRRMFRPLRIAASGLSAQTRRMDAIAQNLANVETTRGPGGALYQRQTVQLQAAEELVPPFGPGQIPPVARPAGFPDLVRPEGVSVTGIARDGTPGRFVYDPGHPDADELGYVEYPNVRIEEELTDLMDAKRTFEANATVFQVAKAILRRAIDI